jgi:GDP-L-fucose synthase
MSSLNSRRLLPGIMSRDARIFVAGHNGMVGSAIVRKLQEAGYFNLVVRTSKELDLCRQLDTEYFFAAERPEYVFLAAAKVGGILANNTYKAEFIYTNLLIASNVIHSAYRTSVKKLLNLGSSCIYPKLAPQPMKEEHLLTGALEPTNEPYAIAKIAAIKLCRYYNEQYGTNFISVMPTNLYGINDNFDLETSHVLPAIIRKFHEAKIAKRDSVLLWGTGNPYREFLHIDDLADASLYLMQQHDYKDIGEIVNVGIGEDITIKELAELIKRITGFEGKIVWDATKPDGTPRKLLDITTIRSLGWKHKIGLEEGIRSVYQWYVQSLEKAV